jgi:hypothetical protein
VHCQWLVRSSRAFAISSPIVLDAGLHVDDVAKDIVLGREPRLDGRGLETALGVIH